MLPRFLAAALLFAGAAAMAEEVAWARAIARVIGSTAGAAAAVVAATLGGMAFGSWIGGRAAMRAGRGAGALRTWGGAAAASGAAAGLLTAAIALVEAADAVPAWAGLGLVGLLALASIPVGAGFPLAIAALGAEPPPRAVGVLYGIGSIGAAAGALLAPLAAIPAFGERRTLLAAALLQLALGAAAAAFAGRSPGGTGAPGAARARPAAARWSEGGAPAGVVLVFLAGFALVYWEILWTRILVLIVGPSVHAFAVAAASAVLGIGIGSILFPARPARRGAEGGSPAAGAGSWAVPLGVLGILAAAWFAVPYLPDAYLFGVRAFGRPSPVVGLGGAGLIVLAACAPIGLVVPWALARAPDRAGPLQAANGAGSALGALLAGPLLAGRIGLEAAYIAGVAAAAAVVLGGASLDRRARPRAFALAGAAAVVVPAGLAIASAGSGWSLPRLLVGVYQWTEEDLLSRDPGTTGRSTLTIREGREAIVSVERDGDTVYVKANGKVEGTVPADPRLPSRADLPTQLLLGALPGLISPGRTAAVIGLGSGTTLGAAHRSALGGIDLIEIEPEFARAIVEAPAGPFFAPLLGGALSSPRVTAWWGDARALLAGPLAGRRWGAIASQPSEPWLAASAPLFTREFFRRAASRLEDGGVFVQWVQLYKLPAEGLEILVRTFRDAFDRVFIIRPPGTGEILLVGSLRPLDLGALLEGARRLEAASPGILGAMALEGPEDLLAAFLLGPDGVDRWVGPGRGLRLNTDDRGDLLLIAPRSLHAGTDLAAANLRAIRERGGEDPITRYLGPSLRAPESLRRLAARNLHLGDFWEALAILAADRSDEADALRREAKREIAALGRGGGA